MIKKKEIKTFDGNCVVTVMPVKHHKSGETVEYLSLSDGNNISGIFLGENTLEEIVEFLGKKEKKSGTGKKSK